MESLIDKSDNKDESIYRIETSENESSQLGKKKKKKDNNCGKCKMY